VNVEPSEPADVASRFLEAFSAADFERMRALLAENVVAYVTDAVEPGGWIRVARCGPAAVGVAR
jgi:ketosteroid isomerase-like protein